MKYYNLIFAVFFCWPCSSSRVQTLWRWPSTGPERSPPSSSSMLEPFVVYSCPVLITGDINIHLDDLHDAYAIKFNCILDSFGLNQSVVGPTHLLGRTRNDLPRPIINISSQVRSLITRCRSSSCSSHVLECQHTGMEGFRRGQLSRRAPGFQFVQSCAIH